MGLQTSLSDDDRVLVADTSSIINLNATGNAANVLKALPGRIVALDLVREELDSGRAKGRRDANEFDELVRSGLIEVVHLGDEGLRLFERLVIGAASDTLDDGEAGTIAFAMETGAVAIVDERKALRICATRYPSLRVACTVDVLVHPAVNNALGVIGLADAVYGALLGARMRVPSHHIAGIVELIGPSRAAKCASLPREARKASLVGVEL